MMQVTDRTTITPTPKNIKIAIADDHEIFLMGLAAVIKDFKMMTVIMTADNGKHLLDRLNTENPDVVLMDIRMPEMNGIETTIQIRKRYPKIRIICLAMSDSKKLRIEMINAGVNGFLLKNFDSDELEKAIRIVVTGGSYFNDHPRLEDLF